MFSMKCDRIKSLAIWVAFLMLLKFNKKFDKSNFYMQYDKKIDWILKTDDRDLGAQNEFSQKSTENIFVVDEHN